MPKLNAGPDDAQIRLFEQALAQPIPLGLSQQRLVGIRIWVVLILP